MEYIIVGLGNPGEVYEETRHNVGRKVVMHLQEKWQTSDWRSDNTLHAKLSQGSVHENTQVQLILPDNYMNRSGGSVAPLVKSGNNVEQLIVVHDDIDLALGVIRIAYNRGAGGHNGVNSIEQAIRSKSFTRVRVGIVPKASDGTVKKPKGRKNVHDFILKKLTKKQQEEIAHIVEKAEIIVRDIIEKGRVQAMCEHNGTIHNATNI